MSYFQSFSNCYDNNHETDDSSTVFDADTVMPDKVPSLPPLPTLTVTATATDYYLYNNNVTISSSPHSSQKESPQSFTSEFLRLINSQRSLAMPFTTTATATRSEEIYINESSSSSSKKRTITNSSSHQSTKRPRRSSRLKRQQPQDQNCTDDKSDSEVEDENGLVINQSSSSSSSQTSPTKRQRQNELKWKSKFEELRAYKQLHGNTDVSRYGKDYRQLGEWVSKQRAEYKKCKKNEKSQISPERVDLLNSIGFEWVPNKGPPRNESLWNKRFNELKEYKEKNDHTDVPQNFKDNKKLGAWVNSQRTQYKYFQANKKAHITKERIEMLESIDFEWVSPKNEFKWNERFNELKAYKEKYDHTNVPHNFKDNMQLGIWVNTQRTEYKNLKAKKRSSMTDDRIEMLESIGFQWECRPGRPS